MNIENKQSIDNSSKCHNKQNINNYNNNSKKNYKKSSNCLKLIFQ